MRKLDINVEATNEYLTNDILASYRLFTFMNTLLSQNREVAILSIKNMSHFPNQVGLSE